MAVRISPLALAGFNRRLLRFLFMKLNKRYPRLVERNLRTAFPDHSDGEIRRLVEAVYNHFSNMFVQVVYLFGKRNPDKILSRIEVKNLEVLERALEKKKGVIIFSAHFGNWELVPFILSRRLNRKINSIARQMDNPLVEKKVMRFRSFMGSEVIYKQNAIRTILKRLEDNDIVYLLTDQNTIEREAVFVDFFGQTTAAVPSVAQLHVRRGVPVVPLFLHYEKDRIVLELLEEIQSPQSPQSPDADQRDAEIARLTQQCAALMEAKIRQYPEQWFWFHDRWKTKPSRATRRETPKASPEPVSLGAKAVEVA